MRRWEFVSSSSAKFWAGEHEGLLVTVCFGRIGTAGQTQVKEFASEAAAAAYFAKVAAEKERKGYMEVLATADATQEVGAQAGGVRHATSIPAEKSPAPADKDALVFPDSWGRHLHPRRGGRPGVRATIDKKALSATDALVTAARSDWLDAALLQPAISGTVVEHVRRSLEGEPTAIGAAALALAAVPRHDGKLALFVDAWTVRHDLAFAAVASVKVGDVFAWRSEQVQLRMDGNGHVTEAKLALLRRMRTLLAQCSEDEYAEAIAALGDARSCCGNCRAAVAYLVPTETDWVAESCREYEYHHRAGNLERLDLLHRALSTPEQVEILGDHASVWAYRPQLDIWVTMLDGLGPSAAPLFTKRLGAGSLAETLRAVGSVLAQVPSDEAFQLLVDRLDQPHFGAAIQEASARFPVRALRILAHEASALETKTAAIARELLDRHVRKHRGVVEPALADLPEPSRAIVLELLPQGPAKPIAHVDSLPMLLVSPPWARRTEAKPPVAPEVVAGLEPPALARVTWSEEELASVARRRRIPNPHWDHAAMAADVARWVEGGTFEHNGHNVAVQLFASGPVDENRELLRRWRPEIEWDLKHALWPTLQRFDADAVPALVHAARRAGPVKAGELLLPVVDLETARLMADWLVRLKSGRQPAEAWFERHGSDAAVLLLADAVGKPGKARTAAEGALRRLSATTTLGLVDLAESEYGKAAAGVVAAILATDPAELLPPISVPALPDWLEPAMLPQVLLRGGEQALSESATRHLLTALALSTPTEPYPGLAATVDALDRAGVAEFGWQVFAAWRSVGYPAKQSWALASLGVLGDDVTVTRLVPLIKAWPGESGHHRAVAGLEVLAGIGTDQALQRLNEIAQRTQFKALRERAGKTIAEIAEKLGLTGEQLADRLVPDLGLDADGGLWLDYGPRRFRVGFDEQLRPYVTDEARKRRKDLPSPNSKDDAVLASDARKQFVALKKEARAVSADQIRRLEAALVDQRSWTATEFTDLLLTHPLLRHVVRRLLWVSDSDGIRTGFRAAEDLTLAGIDDAGFVLPAAATVSLAHPLTGLDGFTAWAEIFADYEILQPFPQLGREVHALTDAEKAGYRLERFEGRAVPIGRILGLTKSGWQRSRAMDNGIENCITKRLDATRYLVIDLDDGIPVGAIGEAADEQTLKSVYLSPDAEVYHSGHRDGGLRFADVDPLTASELLGQLTRLVD